MRTYIYRFALALVLLSGLMACTRNEAPQRRSNSRSSVDHLIIKEVFYIGHVITKSFPEEWGYPPVKSWYEDDQYITIFNPHLGGQVPRWPRTQHHRPRPFGRAYLRREGGLPP